VIKEYQYEQEEDRKSRVYVKKLERENTQEKEVRTGILLLNDSRHKVGKWSTIKYRCL
jgi:hypothetical protein